MSPSRVLLVEDDPVDAALAQRAVRSAGDGKVEHCRTLAEALARLEDRERPPPDVVMLDLSLPDAGGLETFDRLAAAKPPPVVVISGDDDPVLALALIDRGAQDYLVKGQMSHTAMGRALHHAVERARLLEQLEEARDQALNAARSQSAFVAAMSHEIRTPLNAILGMADLLARTELDLDQREYVEIFRRCSRALKELLDNALELARLETGKVRIHEEPFDLEGLAHECLEAFAFAAHRKGLALVGEVAREVGGIARGDDTRLRQVLLNLIGNAVKFTEQGRVVLRVAPAGNGVRIEVEDTGIGIPPDRREAIFERFVQAEAGTTRRFGGSGLGLALCRELVEAMGGAISVESEPGRGSVFALALPLAVEPAEEPPRFQGETVLLLISDRVESGVLARGLRERGAEVRQVDSMEAVGRALAQERIDALLLDARLPGGGGIELLEGLDPEATADLRRIVLLPVDHRVGDLARCAAAGAVGLCKPARWEELDLALRGERLSEAGSGYSGAAPRLADYRILVAEDARDNRTVALAHLAATGCEVEVAVDGEEAVERVREGGIDLVLMDVHMPLVDGCEATRQIRALEAEQGRARTPIVALTADALPEQRQECLRSGCDGHLAKPFERDDLFRVICAFLTPGADPGPDPAAAEATERAGGDADALFDIPPELADLAEDYLARRLADAEALRAAARSGDFATTRRLGHNMKGSGGGYGFPRVSALGGEIQHASDARDPESITRLADALEEYAEKALQRLP